MTANIERKYEGMTINEKKNNIKKNKNQTF
jgi:hypothetical protein